MPPEEISHLSKAKARRHSFHDRVFERMPVTQNANHLSIYFVAKIKVIIQPFPFMLYI